MKTKETNKIPLFVSRSRFFPHPSPQTKIRQILLFPIHNRDRMHSPLIPRNALRFLPQKHIQTTRFPKIATHQQTYIRLKRKVRGNSKGTPPLWLLASRNPKKKKDKKAKRTKVVPRNKNQTFTPHDSPSPRRACAFASAFASFASLLTRSRSKCSGPWFAKV